MSFSLAARLGIGSLHDPAVLGQSLLYYQVTAKLGQGGIIGEVYRARDTKLDREVAIKVIPEAMAWDP